MLERSRHGVVIDFRRARLARARRRADARGLEILESRGRQDLFMLYSPDLGKRIVPDHVGGTAHTLADIEAMIEWMESRLGLG